MDVFSTYFSKKAIIFYIISSIICLVLSPAPILWIVFSFLTVFLFFQYLSRLTIRWQQYSSIIFRKKLFKTALIIRVIAVLFLYFFFEQMTGQPYEFEAADAVYYNELGIHVSDLISAGEYNLFSKLWYVGFSDRGFPIYLGIIYSLFFNSILIVRLINALFGAWTVIFIYKIAQRNFDEKTARIAAIMTMLLPNLIYYTGLHLKETLMIFLLVFFIERADYLLRSRKTTLIIIIEVGLLGLSLFLFRTVLGVSAFAAFFGALIFSSSRVSGWNKRILTGVWVSLIVFIFLSGKIIQEAEQYWSERGTNLESQMKHFSSRQGANKLAEFGSTAVFTPIIIFAPFPTLVNIEGQDNHMMLAGAYFTRNVYAFFVVIGLFVIFKQKTFGNHLVIILFIFLYLAILANSGFALSERFHLPAIPFLIILAAYGITQMNKRNKKYFVPYLILISIVIIGWNWFKLAGRGLV